MVNHLCVNVLASAKSIIGEQHQRARTIEMSSVLKQKISGKCSDEERNGNAGERVTARKRDVENETMMRRYVK